MLILHIIIEDYVLFKDKSESVFTSFSLLSICLQMLPEEEVGMDILKVN